MIRNLEAVTDRKARRKTKKAVVVESDLLLILYDCVCVRNAESSVIYVHSEIWSDVQ